MPATNKAQGSKTVAESLFSTSVRLDVFHSLTGYPFVRADNISGMISSKNRTESVVFSCLNKPKLPKL